MSNPTNDSGHDTSLDEVIEQEPRSKKGKFGQAANGGDQAGPNADDDGRTIAPQKGKPTMDDGSRS